jgi:hypothetical protein
VTQTPDVVPDYDIKWYKLWIELTLKNRLSKRWCTRAYIPILKVILKPYEIFRIVMYTYACWHSSFPIIHCKRIVEIKRIEVLCNYLEWQETSIHMLYSRFVQVDKTIYPAHPYMMYLSLMSWRTIKLVFVVAQICNKLPVVWKISNRFLHLTSVFLLFFSFFFFNKKVKCYVITNQIMIDHSCYP